MLSQFGKVFPLAASVSDSYDIVNAINKIWGSDLRKEVLDSGTMIVVRLDSGTPIPGILKALNDLEATYGVTLNTKKFKVLNGVRLIQGEGCNETSVPDMMKAVVSNGYSMTNLAFGMGSGLIQEVKRSDIDAAWKGSSVTVDGQERAIFKDPVTDPEKRSMAGRLDLIRGENGILTTVVLRWGMISFTNSVMHTVYENGELLVDDDLDTIRERAKL